MMENTHVWIFANSPIITNILQKDFKLMPDM